jgi:hypothetical protein
MNKVFNEHAETREEQLNRIYPPYSRLASRAREEGKSLQETLDIVFEEWREKYADIYSTPPERIPGSFGVTNHELFDWECGQHYMKPDPDNIVERPSPIPKVSR